MNIKSVNNISLKLFNSVLCFESKTEENNKKPIFIPESLAYIPAEGSYALPEIKSHLNDLKLDKLSLNKTFYKSWSKIRDYSELEIYNDKVLYYLSTYGTNFKGEVYIPEGFLDVPDLNSEHKVFNINVLKEEDLKEKSLDLLRSGIALKEETLNLIFSLLNELNYIFTGNEGIKNKEANIMIADLFNIYPSNSEEFIRYIMFKYTGSTSLIKSKDIINKIIRTNLDISKELNSFGKRKLAKVFNRYKPLFLAFKKTHKNNVKIINKISKLSKTLHVPMVVNPLNKVTSSKLKIEDQHWLENATTFSLFKALSCCYSRLNGQDTFVYRIRNGKSWVKEDLKSKNKSDIYKYNYDLILDFLKSRISGEGKTVLIPSDITYALPTSEKLFVGNIPTGTKFTGNYLAAGIYWENSWGADDLDLSGINIAGKIGWNSKYYDDEMEITYSGDKTEAVNGAVEYLHVSNSFSKVPTLVKNNVFFGDHNTKYKIVIGKGAEIDHDYMMNPNEVMAEIETISVEKETVLGLIIPEDIKNSFVLLNFGAGNSHVAGESDVCSMATKALYQQWKNPLTLSHILKELGFNIVSDKSNKDLNIDFSLELDKITKSTFIELFN